MTVFLNTIYFCLLAYLTLAGIFVALYHTVWWVRLAGLAVATVGFAGSMALAVATVGSGA